MENVSANVIKVAEVNETTNGAGVEQTQQVQFCALPHVTVTVRADLQTVLAAVQTVPAAVQTVNGKTAASNQYLMKFEGRPLRVNAGPPPPKREESFSRGPRSGGYGSERSSYGSERSGYASERSGYGSQL